MRDTRDEILETCLAMYCVLFGLILVAELLGFPEKVATPILIWLSVACLFVFAVLARVSRPSRAFIAFVAMMYAVGFFSPNPLWIVALAFAVLFRISPFWNLAFPRR